MTLTDPCALSHMLSLQEALKIILQHTPRPVHSESVALINSLGRTLACDYHAPFDVPKASNSAMDGYAFAAQDVSPDAPLICVGESLAGHPFKGSVGPNQCVLITTGAHLPDGCDTVQMKEKIKREDEKVFVSDAITPGQFVRPKGGELTEGERVLTKGDTLCAASIALLASFGIGEVKVTRRPRVAVLSTGDEIIEPGQAAQPASQFDANRPALLAMLAALHCEIIDAGIVADDPDQLEQTLLNLAADTDLIISSGGVSVGKADYTTEVLAKIGEVGFWKVAIKPGKPFAFGHINNTLYCGLPGNPVSSLVTFEQLVQPIIRQLQGQPLRTQVATSATLTKATEKTPGRLDFQRGIADWNSQRQRLEVTPLERQNSAMLTSLVQANCYLVLSQQQGAQAAGEQVQIAWLTAPLKY